MLTAPRKIEWWHHERGHAFTLEAYLKARTTAGDSVPPVCAWLSKYHIRSTTMLMRVTRRAHDDYRMVPPGFYDRIITESEEDGEALMIADPSWWNG